MSLATSYASALYESVKETGGNASTFDQLEQEIEDLRKTLEGSSDLRKVLYGPLVNSKDKTAVIEAIAEKAKLSKAMRHFMLLLVNKGRLSSFPDIADAFAAVRLEAEGGLSGRLVSADPLTDSDIQGLAQAFTKKIGKKVAFRVSTDPSLLAGMKVTVNGVTYDGSLRSQLEQLRNTVVSARAAAR